MIQPIMFYPNALNPQIRTLVQQASRQAGRMSMPGLAAAYAMLGSCAGSEVVAAAGVWAKAGASRRAHELEPMHERLARVGGVVNVCACVCVCEI